MVAQEQGGHDGNGAQQRREEQEGHGGPDGNEAHERQNEHAEQREETGQKKGFAVKDHRRFDEQGNERSAGEDERGWATNRSSSQETGGETLPTIDFATFVLSFGTSAMVHLGEAPDPEGQTRRNLDLAKQTIDILGLLREKTTGNLTPEETKLLDELLYDLRMRYVSAKP